MTTSLRTPENIVNAALTRIGYSGVRVDNLLEGSPTANIALSLYAQTRDNLLCAEEWGFAERNLPLTLLKTAPVGGYTPPVVWDPVANPILPWIFEYAYPVDCLKLRALRKTPIFLPEFDPQPIVFRIADDNSSVPQQKVILCNTYNVIAVYTGTVTDPTLWTAPFAEALCDELARLLAAALATTPDIAKMAVPEAAAQTERAIAEIG